MLLQEISRFIGSAKSCESPRDFDPHEKHVEAYHGSGFFGYLVCLER